MLANLKLSLKGLLLIAIPLAFEVIVVLAVSFMLNQTEVEIERERKASAMQHHFTKLNALLTGSAQFAQQYGIAPSPGILARYHQTINRVPAEFRILKDLAADQKDLLAQLTELEKTVTAARDKLNQGLELIRQEDIQGSFQLLLPLVPTMHKITFQVDRLTEKAEQAQLASPAVQIRARQGLMMLLAVSVLLNIVLAIVLAIYFNRTTARRLAVVTENTIRFGEGKQLNPALPGKDEIAVVDNVFHDMAASLEAAAKKERIVLDNAVDVICSIGSEARFTAVSKAVETAWGYSREELNGHPIATVIFDRDIGEIQRTVDSMLKEGLSGSFESRVAHHDGTALNTLWSAQYSESENSLFCVVHDITARKQALDRIKESEARATLILDSMPLGLAVIDGNGKIQSSNPRLTDMLGFEQNELTGSSLTDLLARSSGDLSFEFEKGASDRSGTRRVDLTAKRKNGTLMPAELLLSEFQSVEGRQILCVLIDVTARHELERMKQEFVAMVSHDLKTPLTAVQAFMTLINEGVYGDLPEPLADQSLNADRQLSELLRLVSDLLDLEKIEAGHFSMDSEEMSVDFLLTLAIDLTKRPIEKTGCTIEKAAASQAVLVDKDRMAQALGNLLTYLARRSTAGSKISVSAEEDKNFVEISISGRGPALTAGEQEALFDRFGHLKESQVRARGDLGLVLAKAVITQHGGTVGITSGSGGGNTFAVRIPVARTG